MGLKTLYKFMPFRDEGENFFDNFLLRLSSRYALNDPFEVLPSAHSLIKLLRETDLKILDSLSDTEIQDTLLYKSALKIEPTQKGIKIFDKTGLISLTETKRNLLMWSHYADSHRGFVVEFDIKHNFFNRKKQNNNYDGKIHRVLYDRERPQHVNEFKEWFIYKSDEWIYEKEHRFLYPLSECDICKKDKKNINPKDTNEKIYENSYLCFLRTPKDAIVSITLGSHVSEKNEKLIIESIKKDAELNHIKIYKSRICKIRYELIFDELCLQP